MQASYTASSPEIPSVPPLTVWSRLCDTMGEHGFDSLAAYCKLDALSAHVGPMQMQMVADSVLKLMSIELPQIDVEDLGAATATDEDNDGQAVTIIRSDAEWSRDVARSSGRSCLS